jgi:hypothetical protein
MSTMRARKLSCPTMATNRNPAWAELLQLFPIISLAFPFIMAGKVDLSRAAPGFLLGALLTLPISVVVLWRRHRLNPILIGTNLWLWLGLAAFYFPVPALTAWLIETQAFGLFALALAVGIAATFWFPSGYIACPSSDPRWTRRMSLYLLGLTVVIVLWAWIFRRDIRLGGGLPFIVLNVARRVIIRKAPVAPTT